MKPTLLILAAGLGSRYGGIKQMDKIGPSGESIIDYSIYDAIRAGFGKIVFVLNPKIEKDFKEVYEPRLQGKIEAAYVLQKINDVPKGVPVNTARVKPWGTGHAVLVAKKMINEPFAVINADDFYGRQAFKLISDYYSNSNHKLNEYAMVGYKLGNTLSENGTVSRGICQTKDGLLTDVVERTSIKRENRKIVYTHNDKKFEIDGNPFVSMNFWGFSPLFFDQLERDFTNFMDENAHKLKAEFFIPSVVNDLIENKEATIKLLTSNDQWFGVTYQEDKDITINKVNELVANGNYPENLWE
jgi:UTP-glucose-1-phosphate uridylyltransferase